MLYVEKYVLGMKLHGHYKANNEMDDNKSF